MTSEAAEQRAYDVVTMGRVGVDLYPQQAGVGLEDVVTFSKSVGGSATNVAIAAPRLRHDTAVITRTGDDPFGLYVARELQRLCVSTAFLDTVPGRPTPVTFCEILPPDDFPLYFYRQPKAPDLEIEATALPIAAIERAPIFWVTATGLAEEPSRTAHHVALHARAGAPTTRATILDLDYRPSFWPTPKTASGAVQEVLGLASVTVGNREECRVAVGETVPDRAADALLERGVALAIVKLGAEGVLAKTRDETVVVPPHRVDVVNGLGAGDAFGGALCHGLLAGWDLDRVLRFANAAGAIVATRFECSTAMPDVSEIDALLADADGTH